MSVLLIDFESTGIDASKERITEIGAMLVNNDFTPLNQEGLSQLVYDKSYPEITKEVEEVTGITQAMLDAEAVKPVKAFDFLCEMIPNDVEFIIAYNKKYDETLFRSEVARNDYTHSKLKLLTETPWLCGMVDVETNYAKKCWKLSHLSLDYGVAVNPSELHRAINDVELMRKMLIAAKATPQEMYAYQQSPWIYVVAKCRAPWDDGGVSTNNAKAQGFSWQVPKGDESGRVFEKRWVKRMKQKDLQALRDLNLFEVAVIGGT